MRWLLRLNLTWRTSWKNERAAVLQRPRVVRLESAAAVLLVLVLSLVVLLVLIVLAILVLILVLIVLVLH